MNPQNDLEAKQRKANQYLLFSIAVAVLLMLVLVGAKILQERNQQTNPSAVDLETIPVMEDFAANDESNVSEDRYYSNKLNTSYEIPEGWEVADIKNVAPPPGVEDIKLALQNIENDCVIAMGKLDRSVADYKQTSFGVRQFSEIDQYDGSWFTDQGRHQEKIEFSDRRRQFLSHELLMYYADKWQYMLWDEKNNSVADQCVRDFETLLRSEQHHYLPFTYEDYIEGIFDVDRLRYEGVTPGRENKKDEYKLIFTIDNKQTAQNGNTYEVVDLPVSINGQRMYVDDSKLYFAAAANSDAPYRAANASFYRYDITTDQLEKVFEHNPLFEDDNEIMSYVFTRTGDVYYMSGCGGGYRITCRTSLHKFSVNNPSNHEILIASSSAQYIMGIGGDNTIYMANTFGDGGCASGQVYTYRDGVSQTLPRQGGCISSPEYDAYQRTMEIIREQFVDYPIADAIKHQYGDFLPSEENERYSPGSFIFIN